MAELTLWIVMYGEQRFCSFPVRLGEADFALRDLNDHESCIMSEGFTSCGELIFAKNRRACAQIRRTKTGKGIGIGNERK